jgi:electron transfer flavoprotein beta subunit
MKILVTVAEVAVADDEFEFNGLYVDDRYLTHEINEWDEYALEEAVGLAESRDAEVVTVTIGPERAEERIRKALAKGADRAIRVWDDSLAEADVLDPRTKARVLGAVAREADPDLVLSGVQTGDDSYGATGVALGAELGIEWAAVVNTLDLDGSRATVHRELEGGVEERTEIELPAVLTIQTGINEPRYASLRGIRSAQSKPLDAMDLDDLGLAPADLPLGLSLVSHARPDTESEATLLEGEEAVTELADLLDELGVGA